MTTDPSLFKLLRQRLEARAGIFDPVPQRTLADLARSEWSPRFERLMRNRLIMGAMRYGLLHARGKRAYDRVASIRKRLALYEQTGNLEHLVDCANLCLMEFEETRHLNAHFESADDKHHTT